MTSAEYQQLVEFLGRQFTEIDHRFTDADRRFDEMAGQLAELRRDMLGHFDELYRRLDRLEQEYHAITQGLRRIEAGLAAQLGRRALLPPVLPHPKHQNP